MLKPIAVSSVVAFLILGGPSVALAWGGHDDHGDNGGGKGDDDHGNRAPEPITIVGLALGTAGIVGARWVYRKSTRKP
jgi:hypothetical protein